MQLYMVELAVSEWPLALAWYRDILGLRLVRCDAEHQFALLEANGGRVALRHQAVAQGCADMRLVFEVADLATELQRLRKLGVEVSAAPTWNAEGYRRAVIHDSEGREISLFEWRTAAGGQPPAQSPQS